MLFDSHCHLQAKELAPYLSAALERARNAGVTRFASFGTSESDWEALAALVDANPDIYPGFGLHPWYVAERSKEWMISLRSMLERFPRAAVGEIGLDRALAERDDHDQLQVFSAQLELAKELERPVSIHCRKAWGAVLCSLQDRGSLPHGFVLHSYSGAPDLVPELVELGAYFSFSASIALSGNKRGHRSLAAVPIERILIETDSPSLFPHFGETEPPGALELVEQHINEPVNLLLILKAAAAVREINEAELTDHVWQNGLKLFSMEED